MLTLTRTQTGPIGLHLGARFATLVQLDAGPEPRQIHAFARGELPFNETWSTEERDRQTAAALRKLIVDHRFRGREIVSCLGSQELFVQNVRLPKLPPEEVEKVVRWEAEERLPYPVAEAEIRHLMAAELRQDGNVKQEAILLAVHQGIVRRHVALIEAAGLIPAAIDVEPCALLRALRCGTQELETDGRRAYLHLSDKATTVLFAEGNQILFLKYISSGGQHFDLAVSRHMNLPLAEAVRTRAVVTAAAELDRENELHRTIIDAIRTPIEHLATEIELCLRYYKVTFRGRPLERVLITGEEACPWLVEYLADRLATPCEIGQPFATLAPPPGRHLPDFPASWTAAVGLALTPNTD